MEVQKVARVWCYLLLRRLYIRRDRSQALYLRSLLLTPLKNAMQPIDTTKMIVIIADFDVRKSLLQVGRRQGAGWLWTRAIHASQKATFVLQCLMRQ